MIPKLDFVNRLLISKFCNVHQNKCVWTVSTLFLFFSNTCTPSTLSKEVFVYFVCPTEIPQPPFSWKYYSHDPYYRLGPVPLFLYVRVAHPPKKDGMKGEASAGKFYHKLSNIQPDIKFTTQLNTQHFYRTGSRQKYSTGDPAANIAYTLKD